MTGSAGRPVPGASTGLRADVRLRRGALDLDLALEVPPGEVLAVLGPNGAGKTTLLRAVAGLTELDAGSVVVGESIWEAPHDGVFVPPADRSVGFVFQDYRLFPHLTVLDNVAFGLRARGVGRRESHRRAGAVVERLGLREMAARRPVELSGGQSQRVALARALAAEPSVLLLDEPMSALDARTRVEIRSVLREVLAHFGGPTVLVVHDPLEAMILADRILVVEDGRAVQTGTPSDVARRPATEYVARLAGLNLYRGTLVDARSHRVGLTGGGSLVAAGRGLAETDVVALGAGAAVLVAVRPTSIAVHTREPERGSVRNVWAGRVVGMDLLADRVRLSVGGEIDAAVEVTVAVMADLGLAEGRPVWLSVSATDVVAYSAP